MVNKVIVNVNKKCRISIQYGEKIIEIFWYQYYLTHLGISISSSSSSSIVSSIVSSSIVTSIVSSSIVSSSTSF